MLIMQADSFGENLYLLKEGEDSVGDLEYWEIFKESQSMAIMAMIMSEVIALYYDVPIEKFAIVLHDRGNYFGLQPAIRDESSEEEQIKFNEFIGDIEEFCDGSNHVQFDENTNLIATSDKDKLLAWLREFCGAAQVEIHPDIFDDPENVERMFTEEYDEQREWRDVAEESLTLSWVMAALPEKTYGSRDELLKDAYRIRRNLAYNFDQVEAALSREFYIRNEKPLPSSVRQRHRGNMFDYH